MGVQPAGAAPWPAIWTWAGAVTACCRTRPGTAPRSGRTAPARPATSGRGRRPTAMARCVRRSSRRPAPRRPGWGSGGYVLRAFQPGGNGVSFPTQVVPVGIRITVVGEHYGSAARLGVARLRSDGTYDTSFSGDWRTSALQDLPRRARRRRRGPPAEVLTGGEDRHRGGGAPTPTRAGSAVHGAGDAPAQPERAPPTPRSPVTGSRSCRTAGGRHPVAARCGASFVGNQGNVSHQVREAAPVPASRTARPPATESRLRPPAAPIVGATSASTPAVDRCCSA